MTAGGPAASSKCGFPAAPSIRSVEGLPGLRAALLSDAQRLSQSLRPNRKAKSNNSVASPSNLGCQSWGYVVDLSGHWAAVFCCASEASRITALVFDTIDVQANVEELFRAGVLGSLGEETSSRFSVGLRFLLLAPVSVFVRVPLPASRGLEAAEATERPKSSASDGPNEKDNVSRLYLNRDLLPFRRVIIQPVLQARRDDTCLARGVAALLWLFGLTTPKNNLKCFQQFLGKAQEFELEAAVEAKDSNPPWQAAPVEGRIGELQKLEVSPQPEIAGSHDSAPDPDTPAVWDAERATFEPASRLIAADGSPDKFGRDTHCFVQSIPETKRWNEAVHINIAESEHCRRRQQEMGKQLGKIGLLTDLPLNDANADAKACDTGEHAILQAALERWNNLHEDQKLLTGCHEIDQYFSQASSQSCLIKFFLYGRLQRDRSLSRPGTDDDNLYNLVRIPFSVLPFPKLFERLTLRDFLKGSSKSELESPLRDLLLRLEVPVEHWGIAVSDFELGGSGSEAEFWNLVSAAREVRPPRKLEVKPKHRGAKR